MYKKIEYYWEIKKCYRALAAANAKLGPIFIFYLVIFLLFLIFSFRSGLFIVGLPNFLNHTVHLYYRYIETTLRALTSAISTYEFGLYSSIVSSRRSGCRRPLEPHYGAPLNSKLKLQSSSLNFGVVGTGITFVRIFINDLYCYYSN